MCRNACAGKQLPGEMAALAYRHTSYSHHLQSWIVAERAVFDMMCLPSELAVLSVSVAMVAPSVFCLVDLVEWAVILY
jgi:hypothetical protein